MVTQAWTRVGEKTVVNCWKKCDVIKDRQINRLTSECFLNENDESLANSKQPTYSKIFDIVTDRHKYKAGDEDTDHVEVVIVVFVVVVVVVVKVDAEEDAEEDAEVEVNGSTLVEIEADVTEELDDGPFVVGIILESHSAQPCNSSNVLRDEGDSEYLSDLELTDPLAQRGSVFPLLNHLTTEYFKMPPIVEVKKEVMSEEEKEKKVKAAKASKKAYQKRKEKIQEEALVKYVDEQIQKENKNSKEKIISEFEAMNLQARREVLRKFYVPKASLQRKTAGSELGSACYFAHFKPRQVNPTHGGGVLILVNNKINCFKISEFDLDIDHVGIKIDSKGICFYLVSLYVPSNTLKKYLIKSYCELGEDLIILGDLNAKTPVVGCRSLDANGRVLEEIIDSELDLCVLNEPSKPTYFRYNNNLKKVDYSELLDLFLCTKSLANKMTSIEILTDSKMGSDHDPVMCTFGFNKDFRLDLTEAEPH
ncbi:RNA-directed DNA polymerase from mobile element jockey-like [Brachionus plicatilis]|uniref:RNA-directed DNA polymerase from mobile element jockey-like n=1 Tax=Brachionus plicatilis TaxID=10195 RepID=A0A3M7PN75_BRAPC|nr:RNA-directed DNA polymerase from mobile element jockey-like [Brachionus plicatilis]